MFLRENSANESSLTRDAIIAARLNPVLLYDQFVPDGKFRCCCRLMMSIT